MLTEREEYQDSKVIKAMQMSGIFKKVLTKIRSKEGMNNVDKSVPRAEEFKDLDFVTNDPLLNKIVD